MTIPDAALEVFCQVFFREDLPSRPKASERKRVRAALEAYEAALWRPIEEQPDERACFLFLCDDEGYVDYCQPRYRHMRATHWRSVHVPDPLTREEDDGGIPCGEPAAGDRAEAGGRETDHHAPRQLPGRTSQPE
jgi:hypothetical protein